jgi:hypothetical protein
VAPGLSDGNVILFTLAHTAVQIRNAMLRRTVSSFPKQHS